MNAHPAVRLESLTKRYPRASTAALSAVDVSVSAGSVTALVGANGSGKSTLLRLVVGLLEPSAGRVQILGETPSRGADVMRRIGFAASDDRLFPDLSVLDNLAYRASVRGISASQSERAARDALERFAVAPFADRRPAALSAGERQRVLLAAAIVNDPQLLVLDEPSSALDIVAQDDLHRLIESSRLAGRTVLLATHHLEEVWMLATDLLVLNAGSLVYSGPTRDLADSLSGLRARLHALFAETSPCAA